MADLSIFPKRCRLPEWSASLLANNLLDALGMPEKTDCSPE